MESFKEDKILFYMRDTFGNETKLIEKHVERGDDVALKHYINKFMITRKGKNMVSLNVETPKRDSPFLPY